jgi:hypothetical protein
MKALLIHLNGQRFCLAGLPNGGVEASIGLTEEETNGRYSMAVYGVELPTERVSLWPSTALEIGDEVKITVVEVEAADPPEAVPRQS